MPKPTQDQLDKLAKKRKETKAAAKLAQSIVKPPAASPQPQKPASAPSPANSAGGTYNPAANRFTAPATPSPPTRAPAPAFDPYSYSPDADLNAQVASANAGTTEAKKNPLASWFAPVQTAPAPGDTRTRDDRDAQDILGVGATYSYTGDPEDTARQMRAEMAAAEARKKPAKPRPSAFDPYSYSPDADLNAQVAANAGTTEEKKIPLASWFTPVQTAPAPGDTRTRDDRDAQDILGVGATYSYTGDPEDTARQMWAENGVENEAGFQKAADYYNRSTVGGAIGTLRDTVNDISRRAQLSVAEQEAENAYWSAVADEPEKIREVYQQYLASLAPGEREALEITGRLLSPETVYYLTEYQAAQERHSGDALVKAVDWGEEYDRETRRLAEEWGLSEKTLQEGAFFRSFGRMLPVAAVSLASGFGAAATASKTLSDLIMGAGRVLSGSAVFHSAAGNAYEDAIQRGADPSDAMNYATAVGALELATESIISGLGKLGGRALGLGAKGTQIAESFAREIADNPSAREMVLMTAGILGEGAEEFLSELGGYFADRLYLRLDNRSFAEAIRDAGDAILPAMMTSTFFQFGTLLLEGTDAREAAARAPKEIVDDFIQKAGMEPDGTDSLSQIDETSVTRSVIDGPRGPIPEDIPSMSFSDLQTLRQYDKMEKVGGGQGLLERKPPNSPAMKRWFNQGGTVEFRVENGHEIWTYTTSDGISGEYVDGYIRFSREQMYSEVSEVNIGTFTNRTSDRQKAKRILRESYNTNRVPDGYILHHDFNNGVIQLVKKDIHSLFTHRGGYSIHVTNKM